MRRRLAFGVDLGATNVRVALGDNEGRILRKLSERTEINNGSQGLSHQIIRMLRSIMGSKLKQVEGIGIGATGPLSVKEGALVKPTNIPYSFVPLVEPIEKELRLKTLLLNDGSAGVLGEHFFGAGKGIDNMVYVTISTGIGGGVYVDGTLLEGKEGNAAEIGHFTIDYTGDLSCGCGGKGHWEAYCSGKGIPSYVQMILKDRPEAFRLSALFQMKKNEQGNISARNLFMAANSGDRLALELVEGIGDLNATGFACINDAYDPSLITVGGSITLNNQPLVLTPIRYYISHHTRNKVPEIKATTLGEDVVLYGALAKVLYR